MSTLPKNKYLITLVLAAFVGIAVVIVSAMWLRKVDSLAMSEVVVAGEKLDPGMKLSIQNLSVTNWPKENMPIGAVKSTTQLINRTPKMEIAKGEIILERMLVPLSSSGSMAVQIAPGRRAFTLTVNEAAGVAGFALPGNFVDVLLNSKDSNNQEISKIILQKILILAVAQDRLADDSKPKVVNAITIEVTPLQAETIDLARSIGTLSLILRHQNDDVDGDSNGVSRKDIAINNNSAKPVDKKNFKGYSVEIIRGLSNSSGS